MSAIVSAPAAAVTSSASSAPWKPNVNAGAMRMDLAKQWAARPHDQRYLNLIDLEAATKARHDAAQELRATNGKFELIAPEIVNSRADTERLAIGLPNGDEVAPTHWAFGQLARLVGAPAGYLRTLPSQLSADALNYGLKVNRRGDEVKSYSTGDELLAMTGPEYGRIPDFEVVRAVTNVAGDGVGSSRWKVPGTLDWSTGLYDPRAAVTKDSTTLYASDRDVFMFLVDDLHPISVGKLPDGRDDLMFRGFYIQNSEVGSTSLKLAAFYLRAVCCNRIMWGVEGFEELTLRHSKGAPDRFMTLAAPALKSFSEGSSAKLLEGVQKAKDAKLASNDEDMVEFLASRSMSRKRIFEVMEAVEKEEGRPARTAWDVAQGMTAIARSIPHQDERVALESDARKLLDKASR